MDIAYRKGIKVILNTAPVQPVRDELLGKIDLITPNEVEAEILTGIRVDSEEAADKAADWFFSKGVKNVLITLGQSCLLYTSDGNTDADSMEDDSVQNGGMERDGTQDGQVTIDG